MNDENEDDWEDTNARKECDQLRLQLRLLTSKVHLLTQKLQDQEKECSDLRDKFQVVNTKATDLEKTVKDHQSNLSDETYLYSTSPLFRRMKFRLWLHDTYSRLTDSNSRNPSLNLPYLTSELYTLLFSNTSPDPSLVGFSARHLKQEESYKSQLNFLHRQINAFIKSMISEKEKFTLDDLIMCLDMLRSFSRTGEKTAGKFGAEMASQNYERREVHHKLWKSLFGLILFERILSCFAFRMDEVTSKQLYAIENAILTSGTPLVALTKPSPIPSTHSHKPCTACPLLVVLMVDADFVTVLQVRQLLGTVALQYVDNIQLLQKKQDVTIEITKFLFPLFGCKEKDIFPIVSSAVELRNDMTRELAFYSCYWFGVDSKVDLDSVFCEFEGWRDDEGFPLCVFPGFGEMYKLGDGSIKEVSVKPAVVELGWYQTA